MVSAPAKALQPGQDPGQAQRGEDTVEPHRQRGKGARLRADLEGARGTDAVRRETNGWRYPVLMVVYLFALSYGASYITYRVAVAMGGGA